MLLSTAYLPPISYFVNLLRNEGVTVDIHEHYIKQTYRNRCRIAAANGPMFLSIPVNKRGMRKIFIKDVMIDYSMPWQKIHWRSIESAYNNSPYFLYYRDPLEQCINSNPKFLIDLNNKLLEILCKQIHVDCKTYFSEKYIDAGADKNDLRNLISPKLKSEKEFPFYQQVFSEKYGFVSDLSIIDLLFNVGPDSKEYLGKISNDK